MAALRHSPSIRARRGPSCGSSDKLLAESLYLVSQRSSLRTETLGMCGKRNWFVSSARSCSRSASQPSSPASWRPSCERARRTRRSSSEHPCCGCSNSRCCRARSGSRLRGSVGDNISEELWTTKSAELQQQLRRVRSEMERQKVASEAYESAGLQILEIAPTAYSSLLPKNPTTRRH